MKQEVLYSFNVPSSNVRSRHRVNVSLFRRFTLPFLFFSIDDLLCHINQSGARIELPKNGAWHT